MYTIYILGESIKTSSDSIDEKLQTYDFKLQQYKKLFEPHQCSKYLYI